MLLDPQRLDQHTVTLLHSAGFCYSWLHRIPESESSIMLQVYAVGGVKATPGSHVAALEKYDIPSSSWIALHPPKSVSFQRNYAAACTVIR